MNYYLLEDVDVAEFIIDFIQFYEYAVILIERYLCALICRMNVTVRTDYYDHMSHLTFYEIRLSSLYYSSSCYAMVRNNTES